MGLEPTTAWTTTTAWECAAASWPMSAPLSCSQMSGPVAACSEAAWRKPSRGEGAEVGAKRGEVKHRAAPR